VKHLRRLALRAVIAPSLLALAGCTGLAGPPLPAPQWVRLPALPALPALQLSRPVAASSQVWQLLGAITLPGHLDQDALLLPAAGSATRLVPHPGFRWAEPLRDAVPRLLRQDLQQALGAPLWTSPLPPGLVPTRQLRLEILALDAQDSATGPGVAAQARWALAGAGLVARQGEIGFVQPVEAVPRGAGGIDRADALVQAHREALAGLARRLAQALQ
jgi:uncharacterized protein